MTPKQKKGLGSIITGVCFIIAGIVFGFTQSESNALPEILAIIGLVLEFLGIPFVKPEK